MSHIDEDQIEFTNQSKDTRPPVRSEPLLADQVAAMQERADNVQLLCGEILASLRVNFNRGTLTATGFQRNGAFERLLVAWEKLFADYTANARPVRTDGTPRDSGTHEAVVGRSEDA